MLRAYVDNGVVPGLISLVSRGDEAHLEIHGRMAYDGPELERDSLFRVSSFTKPITAAATMLLVDEARSGRRRDHLDPDDAAGALDLAGGTVRRGQCARLVVLASGPAW